MNRPLRRFAVSGLAMGLAVVLYISMPSSFASTPSGLSAQAIGECVVLLHGLGRTRLSMTGIGSNLKRAGYTVVNQGYPSTRFPIRELTDRFVMPAIGRCRKTGASRVHLVTHSLGGILARQYLAGHELPAGSRIVMLAPPNRGSEIVDRKRDNGLYRWLLGPAFMELGTGEDSMPRRLGPITVETGIIAGNDSSDPWFSPIIHGEDDGKVSVDSARLEGMRDFLVVSAGHTFIMRKRIVITQVLHFLRHGRFVHPHHGEPGAGAKVAGG